MIQTAILGGVGMAISAMLTFASIPSRRFKHWMARYPIVPDILLSGALLVFMAYTKSAVIALSGVVATVLCALGIRAYKHKLEVEEYNKAAAEEVFKEMTVNGKVQRVRRVPQRPRRITCLD